MRTLLRREEMNGYPNDKVAVVLDESTRSYYDAEGRLRAVDRRRCVARAPEPVSMTRVVCMGWEPAPGRDPGTFEEYRYDALGRRIAVRSRFDASQCSQARPEPCKSRVTRTVWDGDQLLLELRATGDENLDNHTEWVAYTQGPGIDAPLMVRAKQGGSTHDIIPLANWRGLFEAGVFPDGRTAVDGLDLKTISWPAAGYTAYFDYIPDGDDKEPVWLGSLMSHKRDASGQLYMRNRYYDPSSGRFTQEDPIGLAGGLNLYGFGGGDPVNYSDPYGLAPDSVTYLDQTIKAYVEELRAADQDFDAGMQDLENDVNFMYVFETGGLMGTPGMVRDPILPQGRLNPEAVATNLPIVSIMFDWSHIGPLNAGIAERGLSGGPVTPQMVVGHEVYVHAVPFSRSGGTSHCIDAPHSSPTTCGRKRHNELGARLGWPVREGW